MESNLEDVVTALQERFARHVAQSHPSHTYDIAWELAHSLSFVERRRQLSRLLSVLEGGGEDCSAVLVATACALVRAETETETETEAETEARWAAATLSLLRAHPPFAADVIAAACFGAAQMAAAGRASLVVAAAAGRDVPEEAATELLGHCADAAVAGGAACAALRGALADCAMAALAGAHGDAAAASRLSRRVLIPLLRAGAGGDELAGHEPRVLRLIQSLAADRGKQGEAIVLIAAFFEYLFRCGDRTPERDFRCAEFLWETIRCALWYSLTCVGDAGHRTNMQLRTEYLVKRIVDITRTQAEAESWTGHITFHPYFVWLPGVSPTQWDLFFSVFEATNEYGVHIIQPALQKFDVLIEQVSQDGETRPDACEMGAAVFHPIWVEMLLLKMLQHPNTAVRKLALCRLWEMRASLLSRLSPVFLFSHAVETSFDSRLCVELDRNPLVASFLDTKGFEGDEEATLPLTVIPLADQLEKFYASVFTDVLRTASARAEALCHMLQSVMVRPSLYAVTMLFRVLHGITVALDADTSPASRQATVEAFTKPDVVQALALFLKDVAQDNIPYWLDARLSAIAFSALVHIARIDPLVARGCEGFWRLLCLCGPQGLSGGSGSGAVDPVGHVGAAGTCIDPMLLSAQLLRLAPRAIGSGDIGAEDKMHNQNTCDSDQMEYVRTFLQAQLLVSRTQEFLRAGIPDEGVAKQLFFLSATLHVGEPRDRKVLAHVAEEITSAILSFARRPYCSVKALPTALLAFVEFHHALGTNVCCQCITLETLTEIGDAIFARGLGDVRRAAEAVMTVCASEDFCDDAWALQHTNVWATIVAAVVSVEQLTVAHCGPTRNHSVSQRLGLEKYVDVLVRLLVELAARHSTTTTSAAQRAAQLIVTRNTSRLLQGILSGLIATPHDDVDADVYSAGVDCSLDVSSSVAANWIRALIESPPLRLMATDPPCALLNLSWPALLSECYRSVYNTIFVLCTCVDPRACPDVVLSLEAFALDQAECCWVSCLTGVYDILAWVAAAGHDKVDTMRIVHVMFDHLRDAGAREHTRLSLLAFHVLRYCLNTDAEAVRDRLVAALRDESESERTVYIATVTAAMEVLHDPPVLFPLLRDVLLEAAVLYNTGRDDEAPEAMVAATEPLLLAWPEDLRARYPPTVRLASVGRALAISTILLSCANCSEWARQLSLELIDWNSNHSGVNREPCMPNSRLHRRRIRLWQLLCALLPLVENTAEAQMEIARRVVQNCLTRTNMGSVRRLMELYTLRLLERQPKLYGLIDAALASYDLRPQVCGSYVLIAAHTVLQQLRKEVEPVEGLVDTLLRRLFQQSTSHQHLLRIICHIGLHFIREAMGEQVEVPPSDAAIFDYIANATEHVKYRAKHSDLLFFDISEAGTPRQLFCVQRKEGNVILHESIPAAAFERMRFIEREMRCLIGAMTPIELLRVQKICERIGSRRLLEPFRTFPFIPHSKSVASYYVDYTAESVSAMALAAATATTEGIGGSDEAGVKDGGKNNKSGEENIQRKVTPWWNSQIYNELHPRAMHTARQSIVIVGSLLQNPVNIAGLFRCGEIFAVEKIIVPDSAVFGHPHFVAAARSAELWLPWEAVPAKGVAEYLMGMRRDGYTLVGIEQTAGSVSMASYNFPERAVIVLGAEGQGVPAPILPLLDHCVEIPQFGLIRSLNVHVTGAIVMYEYTRQHLMTKVHDK